MKILCVVMVMIMNRTFAERKPRNIKPQSIENETIIKALNMYGRVPEQWELLQQINQLTNNWNELEEYIIEQEEINNGAMKCGLSSGSEIEEMGIQNDIYDLILDKMKEIKEGNNVSDRD